jgi:hypothetical protein
MENTFWIDNPKILFNKDTIYQLWPTQKMKYQEKMNAISRLVILLTILGFIFTWSIHILLIGIITLISLVIIDKYNIKEKKSTESFTVQPNEYVDSKNLQIKSKDVTIQNPETLEYYLKTDFEAANKKNPFNNVLLTQINDEPNRKAAPPAFNPEVYEDITKSTKKMVQSLNPGIKNTDKQLFGDLGENFYLDQSMRIFNSTPNTRVCNDQGAFSKFLYGDMPSGKDSNIDGAFARVQDNYRYTLY